MATGMSGGMAKVLAVLLALVVFVIAVVMLIVLPLSPGAHLSPTPPAGAPIVTTTSLPFPTVSQPTPTFQRQPTPGPTSPLAPIDFDLLIQQTRASDTDVLLNVKVQVYLRAQLVNLGDFEAHNVRVETRARVRDSYVPIDGKSVFVVVLGAMAPREEVQRDISFEIRMSLLQGRAADTDGIIFELTVVSDERTKPITPMRCTQGGCAPL